MNRKLWKRPNTWLTRYKDRNHDYIVGLLRGAGVYVKDCWKLSRGHPDLVCSLAGLVFYVEIKSRTGRLTAAQKWWIQKMGVTQNRDYFVIRSIDDVSFCLSTILSKIEKCA